jgi:hypothetical protein
MLNPSSARTPKHKGPHRKRDANPEECHLDYQTERQKLNTNSKAHRKSDPTKVKYEGHIRRCKQWMLKFAADEAEAHARFQDALKQGRFNVGEGEVFAGAENMSADPRFLTCLDGPPNEYTPIAIAMYISHECFDKGLSGGTAYSIYSAFLWYYDEM